MTSLVASTTFRVSVDCVEFCPFPNSENLLACGLYQLKNEENQRRIGGIELLKVVQGEKIFTFENFSNYTIDEAGVLACRWLTKEALICACSDGQLRFLNCDISKGGITCNHSIPVASDPGTLLLNLEIDPHTTSCITSDSAGCCALFQIDQSRKISSWNAHDASEVWCVQFHRSDANLLFSGADDCLMKAWDRRTVSSSPSLPVYKLRHDAGVTSIVSASPEKIWTGSYDDHLRLWDLRSAKAPLSQLNLHGGVWRIRPNGQYLLCACMYNGWCIVEHAEAGQECNSGEMMRVACQNTDGKALLYGVDWLPENRGIIATSTFYDNSVRLFDVNAGLS